MVPTNTKWSVYLCPYIFMSSILGFWFGSIGGNLPGEEFMNRLIIDYTNMYLLFGLPLFGILGVMLVVSLLAFFGGRVGKWDLNSAYAVILKKLG